MFVPKYRGVTFEVLKKVEFDFNTHFTLLLFHFQFQLFEVRAPDCTMRIEKQQKLCNQEWFKSK
jgi:hypothetical protein